MGWPVKLIGGKVNLGAAGNYPANALPLTKFKMLAYKADGTGGLPGTVIDSVEITPAGFGWVDFSFSAPITINTGDFYLAMRQGGVQPHAAGLGVDLTNTQLRSYSKFATGGGGWVPAAGNFMIRAILQGTGGPLLTDNASSNKVLITATAVNGLIYESPVASVTGYEGVADYQPLSMTYEVWRLLQGQEGTQSAWTSIWTGGVNSATDNQWPTLVNGPYRWAVKAIYGPGQRPSAPTFSNVIGKGWTANVNICVSLTCAANPKEGTLVKLVSADLPDTTYTKVTDATGCVHFTNVWKGNYLMTITRFTYPIHTETIAILGDATFNVTLLQEAAPPTNLAVNDQTLHASWSPPRSKVTQLDETFTTGGFTTNQWEVTGGTNWQISATVGKPAPSAMFNWTPEVYNYDQYLTSKSLAGIHAPQMKLYYDIFLSNFATTNINTMAVELWNGTTWSVLKSYDNMGGDIPWSSETLDITSQTHNPAFKVRFHAAGVDSYDIMNWNIDNIKVVSGDGSSGPNPCVLGYNFYLNNVLSTFTTDTTYNIPPSQVVYGQVYEACVKAVYGSGYSPQICVTFTSHFLYPARDLTATGIECNTYLTWKKPVIMADAPQVPAFDGVVEHTTANAGPAPKHLLQSVAPVPTKPSGVQSSNAFGINASSVFTINFDVDNVSGATNVAALPNTTDFWHDLEFPANQTDYAYAIKDGSDHLYKVIRATGAFTDLGSMGSGTTDQLLDLAIDGSNGDIYAVSSDAVTLTNDKLWKIDPAVPSATLVGLCVNSSGMIGLAGDKNGNLWGYDLVNDNFYAVDKATGVATVVGPIGFNANYGQCMFFDETANAVTMAAYNATSSMGEIRAVDVTTGASVVLSSTADQIAGASLPVTTGGGGGTPAGLIGYNIYRGGTFQHYNPHPDSVTYYDYGLDPGIYKYDVKAKYDLTPYGFPGQFGESLGNTAGEKTVTLNCGRPLPFFEPWTGGSFEFNGWQAAPGHWSINTGIGNTAPCADFTWQPAITNYSQAFTSDVINASPWNCAKIWLDFDVKLVDRNNTGKEKLTVELFYAGIWHQKLEVTNNGSTSWVLKHLDISAVKGKSFRVRFVAHGLNSADILHWYVDNIHAYGMCNPATAFHASQSHFTTTLTWVAPECVGTVPTQLKKLFQWSGTPDNAYYEAYNNGYGVVYDLAAYPDASLNKIDFHHASWGTTGTWQYKIHVVDWTTYAELATLGPLTTTGNDIWENNIPLGNIPGVGGKLIGIMLEPMSNSSSDAYPDFSADNTGPDGVSLHGALPDYSAFITSTIGDFLQNLWIEVPLDDKVELVQPRKVYVSELQTLTNTRRTAGSVNTSGFLTTNQSVFTDNVTVSDSSVITGYNVYRTAATGVAPYLKLNSSLLTATTYVDTYPSSLVSGTFRYYVTVVYKNSEDNEILCQPSSDTLLIAFPHVGFNELTKGEIMIYPNPATEVLNIKSDYTITGVDAMNFVGQKVYSNGNVDSKTWQLNVSGFKTGVYFVKVSTTEGIRMVKITVTH